MEYRQLGNSTLKVSLFSMGCFALGGGNIWGDQDESDSIKTVHKAIDFGINTFDTAEGYENGASELILGKALVGKRSEAIVVTKVSPENLAQDTLKLSCENSLKRLRSDYIDLYMIHWPNPEIPLSETVEALESLKKEGKIREYGVSNFGILDMSDLLSLGSVCVNQLPYSLVFRAIEFEIQDYCLKHGIGIMCYTPLFQGLLTGKFETADDVPPYRARSRHFSKNRPLTRHGGKGHEKKTFQFINEFRIICKELHMPMSIVALAWLKEQKGVSTILVGARTPDQVDRNNEAYDYSLPKDALERITCASEKLKNEMGSNPDTHQEESRFR